MNTLFSTALKNYQNTTGDLQAALNNGFIGIWSGPVPASADDAVDGSCVLLATISNGGDGTTKLTFAGTSSNGVLTKTPAEDWKGPVVASGNASFFRYYIPSDTGATADSGFTYNRVQGNVGNSMTSEMVLPNVALVSGNTQALSAFQIGYDQ